MRKEMKRRIEEGEDTSPIRVCVVVGFRRLRRSVVLCCVRSAPGLCVCLRCVGGALRRIALVPNLNLVA